MARLFTPKIADFYEEYYESKGVNFIKGTVLASFENNSDGKVGDNHSFFPLFINMFLCFEKYL